MRLGDMLKLVTFTSQNYDVTIEHAGVSYPLGSVAISDAKACVYISTNPGYDLREAQIGQSFTTPLYTSKRRFGGMTVVERTQNPTKPGTQTFKFQIDMEERDMIHTQNFHDFLMTLEEIDEGLADLAKKKDAAVDAKIKADERSNRLLVGIQRFDKIVREKVREETASLHRQLDETQRRLRQYENATEILFGNGR